MGNRVCTKILTVGAASGLSFSAVVDLSAEGKRETETEKQLKRK
jgi:hypothetical protein